MCQLHPWILPAEPALERTSKYDYCCGNDHFAYQTWFDFYDNQHRLKKKDQYLATVGAEIFEKIFWQKIFNILQKKSNKNLIKKDQNPFLKFRLPQLMHIGQLSLYWKTSSKWDIVWYATTVAVCQEVNLSCQTWCRGFRKCILSRLKYPWIFK